MGVGGGGGHHAGWGLGGPRGRGRRVARGSRGASDAGGAFAAGAADLAQAKVCHGMNRGRGGGGSYIEDDKEQWGRFGGVSNG